MINYIKFSELPVYDQDRAIAFYTEILGFRVKQDSSYKPGWRWVELAIPGAETRIRLIPKTAEQDDSVPSLVLVDDDVPETYEELRMKGVLFTQTPSPAPWRSTEIYALFKDSESNTILIGSE